MWLPTHIQSRCIGIGIGVAGPAQGRSRVAAGAGNIRSGPVPANQ
jgi:hypothetical protein